MLCSLKLVDCTIYRHVFWCLCVYARRATCVVDSYGCCCNCCLLSDGVGFAHLSSQGQEIIKTVVNMASHNYPGTISCSLYVASVYCVPGNCTRGVAPLLIGSLRELPAAFDGTQWL
jgi:hypothetical protein